MPIDGHAISPGLRPSFGAAGLSGRVWPMPIDGHAVSPGPSPPWGEADCVDATVSDLPAEVDLSALPRWMRAVPEQGPPEGLEFEAGRGPANDWD
jgi:hypothetical protein